MPSDNKSVPIPLSLHIHTLHTTESGAVLLPTTASNAADAFCPENDRIASPAGNWVHSKDDWLPQKTRLKLILSLLSDLSAGKSFRFHPFATVIIKTAVAVSTTKISVATPTKKL